MCDPDSSTNTEDFVSNVLPGNKKWAQRLHQFFPQYFPDPKHPQFPKLLWLGCSDSRVQESDATTALPGTAFVHRNIANQFHANDDNAISVLGYAVAALGVRHIAVVGHDHCGGVITAIKQVFPDHPLYEDQLEHNYTLCDNLYHSTHKNQLNGVYDKNSKSPDNAITRWLTPLVNRVREIRDSLPTDKEARLKIVTEENVKLQIENIGQLDREWLKKHGPIWVHGWVYDFSSGFIRDLKITKKFSGTV